MTQYNPKHIQEWKKSKIHRDLIRLNFKTVPGLRKPHEQEETCWDYLFYSEHIKYNNNGYLPRHYFRKYACIDSGDGGWVVFGEDPRTGEIVDWCQVKLNQPRTFFKNGKEKIIKYESPIKIKTELMFLGVTYRIGLKIARKHGLKKEYLEEFSHLKAKEHNPNFWKFVAKHNIAIYLTEGAKKAAALLSAGYAAISCPGIWNNTVKDWIEDEDFLKRNPYLEPFLTKDREIVICFDQEKKPKTRKAVNSAMARWYRNFNKYGVKVSVCEWDHRFKGIDDFIYEFGEKALDQILSLRLSFGAWRARRGRMLSNVNVTQNLRYLELGEIPEKVRLVALKSPKNTGKTYALEKEVDSLISEGKPVIVLTHRIQLMNSFSDRFGINSIEEIYSDPLGKMVGFVLCVDSLHRYSKAKFDPEDFTNCIVIIDEIEQFIWHLLAAMTDVSKRRIEVMMNLTKLLEQADRAYIADADLSNLSINLIQQLMRINYEQTLIIENNYKFEKELRRVFFCSDKKQALAEFMNTFFPHEELEEIKTSGKALVLTDGQKAKSKYGTQTLLRMVKKIAPDKKVLVIDSETVADPKHPAFGCINKINTIIQEYDIIICSPTICTGVSIEVYNYFDKVICISSGILSGDSVCQFLERLRDVKVPRYLWVPEKSRNTIGNFVTAQQVLRAEKFQQKNNINLLRRASVYIEENDSMTYPFMDAYAELVAKINCQYLAYADYIKERLRMEGYEIIEDWKCGDSNIVEKANKLRIDANEEVYEEYLEDVEKIEEPTPSELEALAKKKAKTKEERLKERKASIKARYGEINKEIIRLDDNNMYPKLRLLFFLTLGRSLMEKRDKRVVCDYLENNQNRIFSPDFNKIPFITKVYALEVLGIKKFIEEDLTSEERPTFDKYNLEEWNKGVLKFDQNQIKSILGFRFSEKVSPVENFRKALKALGLSLTKNPPRLGSRDNRRRVYQIEYPNLDLKKLFQWWFDKEESLINAQQEVSTVLIY